MIGGQITVTKEDRILILPPFANRMTFFWYGDDVPQLHLLNLHGRFVIFAFYAGKMFWYRIEINLLIEYNELDAVKQHLQYGCFEILKNIEKWELGVF